MKLVVTTQYMEYYGTPECGRWKAKGGMHYYFPLGSKLVVGDEFNELISKICKKLDYYHEFGSEEYVVDWSIERDDYLTPLEKDQLEYEGQIRYPAKEIVL